MAILTTAQLAKHIGAERYILYGIKHYRRNNEAGTVQEAWDRIEDTDNWQDTTELRKAEQQLERLTAELTKQQEDRQ